LKIDSECATFWFVKIKSAKIAELAIFEECAFILPKKLTFFIVER